MNTEPILLLGSVLLITALIGLIFWPQVGLFSRVRKTLQSSRRVQLEDALKYIHKCVRHGQEPSLEGIAGSLGITTNRASEILVSLEEGSLINFSGERFSLSPAGEEYALRIIRAHRIWERYLADKTGYAESEWHQQAERLEHSMSQVEVDYLSANLGNPTHDPHGDPIPTREGEWVDHGGVPLTELPTGSQAQIVHLEDEPDIVYEQLLAEGLFPGMVVRISESSPQRVRFWTNGEDHVLSPVHARNISAQPLEKDQPAPPQGSPLHSLNQGESAVVLELSPAIRGMERRRLMDLGVLPGTVISAELRSPGNDPTAYRIRGALIALRDQQAQYIKVERLNG